MMKFIFIILVTQAVTAFSASGQTALENKAVYKIINKADNGVLTIKNSDSSKVILRTDSNGGDQKWRAKNPVLSKDFELKPTSNEDLTLAADEISLSKVQAGKTSGNSKYWRLKYVGENVYEIKNYMTSTCLESKGLNNAIGLSSCSNTPQQQWTFKKL